MFKRFFMFMMVACLFVVQANAATHNNLKTAFDDLHYALTVEWDQKDRAFYTQEMDKFALTIKELQAQGMTNQELVDFAVSQVKNERVAKDLRTAFTVVMINNMTGEEAHKYVTDIMSKSYGQGASWAGEAIGGVIALVVFVALAAIVAGKAKIEDGCYKIYSCNRECWNGFCAQECDYRCI